MNTPMLRSRFWDAPLTPAGLGWTYLVILIAYAYQAILPSLNSDDVIQIQSISGDAMTFIASGRWLFYAIFEWIQNNNPGGLFASAVGLAALLASSWMALRIIEFRHGAAVYAFLLLSSISIYYGMLFNFSSTRLAYPLANLLALGGLWLFLRRKPLVGVALMSLAPAIYPAAAQVAGMTLICMAIAGLLREPDIAGTLRRFAWGVFGLLASLVLYAFITGLLYQWLGLPLSGRTEISPFAIIDNFAVVKKLFLKHSIPFISISRGSPYISLRWILPLGAIFLLFIGLLVALCRTQCNRAKAFLVAGLIGCSFLAPFALAFAGSNTPFPPRSLIALAVLHAFWVAFFIDWAAEDSHSRRLRNRAGGAMLVFAGLFVFDSAAQFNKYAFDMYLATRVDLLATNRIVQRIETLAAEQEVALLNEQPLVVIYDQPIPVPSSPRGDVGTARFLPWSREWIFRIVDPRYRPAPQLEQAARDAAQGRGAWPSKDAVFFMDETVVVIISMESQATE